MQGITVALPYQTAFAICTDQQALIDLFRLKHGRYVTPYNDAVENRFFVTQQAASCTIRFKKDTETTNSPFDTIERLMHRYRRYDETVFALHGAAVEHSGKASIFLAATGSGKTTLTAYLTANGFPYITDDCVLLKRADLSIHPCTTPIHLRDGGLEALLKYGALPSATNILETSITRRHVFTPESIVESPLPLDTIYFIERSNHNSLCDMSATDKIAALMKAPITEYPLSGEYIAFLARLTKVPCYRLFYKDMSFVAEVIRHE